jgi:HEAT repeat protein
MERIADFVTNQPNWVYAAVAGTILLIVLIVVASLIARARFRKRVLSFLAIPGTRLRTNFFTDEELLRRTRLVERIAAKVGPEVITALGMDELWTRRLGDQERPSDFARVLRLAPERGLFTCFLIALRSTRLRPLLSDYLATNRDFLVIRRLALSGRGEEFSGNDARAFFAERLDEIREMAGDPEWPSRYFAVKILLYDDDPRSARALWDAFADPYPLVRRTVAAEFQAPEREALYERLMELFRHDPVLEVRAAARSRLAGEFNDLYSFDTSSLTPEDAFHVVPLLDPESKDDENVALTLLAGKDLELRLPAARFLVGSGTLERLFLQADLGDRTGLARIADLLENAASVNVIGFLDAVRRNPAPGSLYVAARVLQTHGPAALLVETAERVFRLQREVTPNYHELYRETVAALRARGSDEALRLLDREIVRRRGNPELLRVALEGVPEGRTHVFAETLTAALLDPDFPERETLRKAFGRLDPSLVLHETLGILSAGREHHAHRVRIDALKILGALNLRYALQEILEHLPILPVEDAREFTALLQKFQPKQLEHKVGLLLDSVDGSIRAAVIAALPATGKRTFLPQIKQALSDADPDVRIAATWALVDYEETRALGQAASMLRDPVPRVRESVAKALGSAGGDAALDELQVAVSSENEVESVKRAAIEGLGVSASERAVDLLVEVLEKDEDLREAGIAALAAKRDARSINRMVEHFKDATPELRDHITSAFRAMGEAGEEAIHAVLEEDIVSLKPFLARILESTGYVDSRVRMLSHRDPRVRRDAALFLSRVGSKAAFRGIVLAARDPDDEVRVQVTKALERLATDEGNELLRSLQEDPDRRIRRYTAWAMERLEAKSL